jgi:hypothetical protein
MSFTREQFMKNNRPDLKITILFNTIFVFCIIARFFDKTPSVSSHIAYAYLDPGTGSMIISAIVGIAATLALGIKTFWYKIVRLFKPGSKKPDQVDRNR